VKLKGELLKDKYTSGCKEPLNIIVNSKNTNKPRTITIFCGARATGNNKLIGTYLCRECISNKDNLVYDEPVPYPVIEGRGKPVVPEKKFHCNKHGFMQGLCEAYEVDLTVKEGDWFGCYCCKLRKK
jgi:hypothetical protein